MRRFATFFIILLILGVLGGCAPRAAVPEAVSLPESRAAAQGIVPEKLEPEREDIGDNITLTIHPGDTIARVAWALEEMGALTSAEFVEAVQSGDFGEFPLVAALPHDSRRFFALEGYLLPGEIEIYPGEAADEIIRRMLAGTERMIDEQLRDEIARRGLSVDEVLTMASIIQRESLGDDAAKPLVSSVIHNRIRTGMMLQMCMTSFYVRDYIAPFYPGDPARFHTYYNTYYFHGLPAGPICNPGLPAIRAALFPAQTAYFFYIWDNDDNFHFAAGWEEHVANVQRYLG